MTLFSEKLRLPLYGEDRRRAERTICQNHYMHSIPSGKSWYFAFEDAIVVFSIPANSNINSFLLGKRGNVVWELSRLWAPDGHRANLLTEAISYATRGLCQLEPKVEVLVSYADPNVGHKGGVYRAACWIAHGQCEENRYYVDATGQVVSRRKFHRGSKRLKKSEIEALGFRELKRLGRLRFVRPLTKAARRRILSGE